MCRAGEAADLSCLPPTIRGAPTAPPDEARGYAGGRLKCIKVLGAFVGDTLECSRQLVARVEKHLKPLRTAVKLRDTHDIKVAMQVQLEINRFCANTQLVYFLRTMPLAATEAAAARHDQLIGQAFHDVVGTQHASPGERARALDQARLPVKMGGLGLTLQSGIAPAARIGTWALCWRPLQVLCPRLFADVDIDTARVASFEELRREHATLSAEHRRIDVLYKAMDALYYDYDKEGEGHSRFHPLHLPASFELVPVSQFGSSSDYLQNAQRTWSKIYAHGRWLALWTRLAGVSEHEGGGAP